MTENDGAGNERIEAELGELSQKVADLEKSRGHLAQDIGCCKEELQKYRILLEHLPLSVFYKDCNKCYRMCNRTYALSLRVTPDEVIGRRDYDFYPASLARKLEDDDKSVLESSRTVENEYIIDETGWPKVALSIKVPVKDENGAVIGILGILRDMTQNRGAEKALRESEESFRLAFENARDAIIWADTERELIVRCNKAAAALLERDRDEVVGSPLSSIHPPEKADHYARLFRKTIHEKAAIEGEIEVIAASGRIIPVHISTSFTTIGRDQIVQSIFHDITERRRWEDDIKRRDTILDAVRFSSEQFLNSNNWETIIGAVMEKLGEAVDASRVYIFEVDFTGSDTPMAMLRHEWHAPGISSLTQNQVLKQFDWREHGLMRWEEILLLKQPIQCNVKDLPEPERAFLMQQNVCSTLVFPVFVNDEAWGLFGFEDCLQERAWSDTEVDSLSASASVLGVAIGRSMALGEIQANESKFRSITETAVEAIICCNATGSVLFWNEAAEAMLGYSALEAAGRPVTDIMPDPLKDTFNEAVARAVDSGKKAPLLKDLQVSLKTKSGSPLPAEISLSAWGTSSEKFFSVIIHDITKRIEAERTLHHAREEFLATLTHDMKGPLTAINSSLYLFNKCHSDSLSDIQMESMKMIHYSLGRLLDMIDNIIEASYLDDDNVDYIFDDFPFDELLEDLSMTFGAASSLNKIMLDYHCPQEMWVHGDRRKLGRIVHNLVGNAFCHTPPGGRITITAALQGNRYEIAVKDTGKGISESEHAKIFRKYGKASQERRGTGLGLYIVKNFLRGHGSDIRVESTPGAGAAFFFTIEKAEPC